MPNARVGYPRRHDVSMVLYEIAERKTLTKLFISALPEITLISERLAEEGGPASYSDEVAFHAAGIHLWREAAEKTITDADKVLSLCEKLFEGGKSQKVVIQAYC